MQRKCSTLFCVLFGTFLYFVFLFYFFIWCVLCVFCLNRYVYESLTCFAPGDSRREYQIVLNWRYLWTTIGMLGTETKTSEKARNSLNCWAVNQHPRVCYFNFNFISIAKSLKFWFKEKNKERGFTRHFSLSD